MLDPDDVRANARRAFWALVFASLGVVIHIVAQWVAAHV